MTATGIPAAELSGVLRMTWVRDQLAHVLEHTDTDEPSGTWTGLAWPRPRSGPGRRRRHQHAATALRSGRDRGPGPGSGSRRPLTGPARPAEPSRRCGVVKKEAL